MEENFECELLSTEEETIKKCSNVEIISIINKELGRGSFGVVYPVIIKIGSEKITLIMKKISKTLETETDEDIFIEDMYDEVDYSYDMGKNGIGPRVYDAFFYQEDNIINQYILMEKFDINIADWLLSDESTLTKNNCDYVSNRMLDILYKQIFILNTYCGDIKTENFVMNFKPIDVRMIDFGIDWCSSYKLPNAYSKVKSIRNLSTNVKRELFYCMCTLQLFMNILNIGTPNHILKMILKPFFMDDIFIRYVLENALKSQLNFETKRIERRSKKRTDKMDFRKILKDMLEYKHDQATLLRHYIKKYKNQSNDEIISFVFDKIKEMSILIFKKH